MARVSYLLAGMLMSAQLAHAADQGSAAPAPVEVAPLAGSHAVSTVIPAPAPTATASMDSVPSASMADEAAQQQQQAARAKKMIGLLRATVKETKPQRGFFSGLFSSSVRPIDTELLAETGRFIERYPALPDTAEVYQLRAQVHQRIDAYQAAAVDWLLSLAAYPDSAFAVEAHNNLKALVGDQLKQQAKVLQDLIVKVDSVEGDREQRVADLLAYMGTLNDKDFAGPVADACISFLMRNRDYTGQDRVLDALARQKALLDSQSAIYYFEQLLSLYPDSALRPDAMLGIADVQRNGLKHYEEAATSYKSLIAKYPDSDKTKLGYEALAGMYDENMHNYSNAIKTYDAIIARYNNDPVVLRSLQAQALIYQNKTSQPLEAIADYRKLEELFKGKEGLAALLDAEQLARYTVSDWKLAIDINHRIINDYPDSKEAPKALFANAGIYEEKLKDKDQALKLYQLFLSHYPGDDLAVQAKQRISALQQKKN